MWKRLIVWLRARRALKHRVIKKKISFINAYLEVIHKETEFSRQNPWLKERLVANRNAIEHWTKNRLRLERQLARL